MKEVNNLQELRREFKSVKSVCAGDTRFIAQAILLMATKLDTTQKKEVKKVIKNSIGKDVIIKSLRDCIKAMEMLEGRMNEELHINTLATSEIWNSAKTQAKKTLTLLEKET